MTPVKSQQSELLVQKLLQLLFSHNIIGYINQNF